MIAAAIGFISPYSGSVLMTAMTCSQELRKHREELHALEAEREEMLKKKLEEQQRLREVQDQEAQEAQRLRELRSKEAMEQEAEIQRKRAWDILGRELPHGRMLQGTTLEEQRAEALQNLKEEQRIREEKDRLAKEEAAQREEDMAGDSTQQPRSTLDEALSFKSTLVAIATTEDRIRGLKDYVDDIVESHSGLHHDKGHGPGKGPRLQAKKGPQLGSKAATGRFDYDTELAWQILLLCFGCFLIIFIREFIGFIGFIGVENCRLFWWELWFPGETKDINLEEATPLESLVMRTSHTWYLSKFAEFMRLWHPYDMYAKYSMGLGILCLGHSSTYFALGVLSVQDYYLTEYAAFVATWAD
eukprot:Skav209898  [mRNA]  locus=scaffold2642:404817:414089:- [translate_table: standard]